MKSKIELYCSVLIFVVVALVAAATVLPAPAAAAVGIKVYPGLGGVYKAEQPLKLTVTVENTGPSIEGRLLVRLDEDRYRNNLARFTTQVNVPAGASKKYNLIIPGEFARAQPVVQLYAGDVLLAQSRVEGTMVSGNRVAVALSESITGDGSGLQNWLSKEEGSQINLKYLSPGELPADPLLLDHADIIMTDAAGGSQLNASQVQMVKDWVRLGGTLVLFAGAENGIAGCFSDISPVQLTGHTAIAGNLGGLRSGAPLETAAGRLVAGRVLAGEDGVPVLAGRKLGRGQVLYCGVAPDALGTESQELWSTLFGVNQKSGAELLQTDKLSVWRPNNSLINASSYLPGLTVPVLLLVALWLAYVIALGPLLYFILRRTDRRDWAWVLVPAAALVTAGCFYLLAPVNRLQNHLSQTLATVEIFTPELAEVRTGTSIVFPRGGNLTVQVPNNIYAVPTDYYGNNTMPVTVCRDQDHTGIEFKDIEFGSLRKIYTYGLQREFGIIEGELYIKEKRVVGDLINKTGLDLRDCRLVLGGRVVKLGALSAGGAVHIDETQEIWQGFPSQAMLFTELGIGGRSSRPGEPFFLERQMMMSGLVQGNNGYLSGVQFLGWHDGVPDIFEIKGNSGQKDDRGMILVKQNINMELAEGKFRLPAGIIKPHSVINSQQPIQYREEKVVRGRTANLSYCISDAELGPDFTVEALELQKVRGQFSCTVEIYNFQQDEWETVNGTEKRIAGDDLALYMHDDKIMVRLTQTGEIFDFQQVWPGLAVEGVVAS